MKPTATIKKLNTPVDIVGRLDNGDATPNWTYDQDLVKYNQSGLHYNGNLFLEVPSLTGRISTVKPTLK